MTKAGSFITLEGVEGVGKTTNMTFVCEQLTAHLEASGRKVVRTREPGGTPLAEEIRELLLAPRDEVVANLSELLLMFAARAQHLETQIKPTLAQGDWVVCDRFTDATYAYQGGGRGLPIEQIQALEQLVHGNLQPDLTLYLDLPWELAAQRIADREHDRLESESHQFFVAVRQAYLDRAASTKRFTVISAAEPLAQVQDAIGKRLQEFLQSKGEL